MRILILTHNRAGVGGSFQRAYSLGRALASRQQDVIVISGRFRPGLIPILQRIDGLTLIQPPDLFPTRIRHGGLSPMDVAWRALAVAGIEADIVHAFDHRPAVSFPAIVNRRLRGSALISDWSDLWGGSGIAEERGRLLRMTLGSWDGWAEDVLRKGVDGVTAAGSQLVNRSIKLGVPLDQILLLPPGANQDLIDRMDKEQARLELGLPSTAQVIAHAGLAGYDGDLLSAALLEILRRRPRAYVLTAGIEPPGLAAMLDKRPERTRWRHMGFVPYAELGPVLGAADVLLLPYSNREINRSRFPNKLGDYLAAGRPIVTNATGDVGPLIEDEEIGILADEDPLAMADAVLSLAEDPPTSERMGERARRLAEGRYAWETLAEQVLVFYASIIARGKDPTRRTGVSG